jgi:hypothetical protein
VQAVAEAAAALVVAAAGAEEALDAEVAEVALAAVIGAAAAASAAEALSAAVVASARAVDGGVGGTETMPRLDSRGGEPTTCCAGAAGATGGIRGDCNVSLDRQTSSAITYTGEGVVPNKRFEHILRRVAAGGAQPRAPRGLPVGAIRRCRAELQSTGKHRRHEQLL